MMIAGPQAAAMFRAGECLESMGEKEKALQAFDEAFELGRASSDYRQIQESHGTASMRWCAATSGFARELSRS